MPTLTASPALRKVAQARGLELTPEPVAPPPPAAVEISPADPVAPEPEPAPALSAKEERRQIWRTRQREREKVAREHLWPLLSTMFPAAFRLPPVPLAVGIHKQILKVAGDSIDPGELAAFMRYWSGRRTYREALWRGEVRHNLDGTEAGVPAIDQRNHAGASIWRENYRPIPESGTSSCS